MAALSSIGALELVPRAGKAALTPTSMLGGKVVDLIRAVPTTTRTGDTTYQNIPVTNVVIQTVTQTR